MNKTIKTCGKPWNNFIWLFALINNCITFSQRYFCNNRSFSSLPVRLLTTQIRGSMRLRELQSAAAADLGWFCARWRLPPSRRHLMWRSFIYLQSLALSLKSLYLATLHVRRCFAAAYLPERPEHRVRCSNCFAYKLLFWNATNIGYAGVL